MTRHALAAFLLAVIAVPAFAQQGPPTQLVPMPVPRPDGVAPAAPAQAQAPRPTPTVTTGGRITAEQQATLRRISEVYNGIREMNGRFVQVEQSGARSAGRFYITKPGRVRFTYDRPSPLEIIADGTDVVVRDRRLNTQDLYPLSQTPLRYLLNDRIDLVRDARVVGVFQDQDMISVTIEERTQFAEGKITLFFDSTSMALRQWTITDARGNETAVSVQNVATNQRNNPQLFAIDRSAQTGRP